MGDRFAKGSSSKRSDGGEFLGVVLPDGDAGMGTIGIAGGNANSVVVAAAECERCLGLGIGGDTAASDASAG